MARYQYSSDNVREEFRKLRDRLYHEARRGAYSGAYDMLKEELKNIDYIDEDVLDYLETFFKQNMDVNKVNPVKYNDVMVNRLMDYINDLIAENQSYPNLVRKLIECENMLSGFINEIGKYAFSDFMDNHTDVMDYIEKIYEIYMGYLAGDITYEEFESQVNAILYTLESLYGEYAQSEQYEEYKKWEKELYTTFRNDFDIYDSSEE